MKIQATAKFNENCHSGTLGLLQTISFSFLLTFTSFSVLIGQTSLGGKVVNPASGEAILFSSVALYQNDVLLKGTETDINGNYLFNNLETGTYSVETSKVGHYNVMIIDVFVKAGQRTELNILNHEGGLVSIEIQKKPEKPLIDLFNTSSGAIFSASDIRRLTK